MKNGITTWVRPWYNDGDLVMHLYGDTTFEGIRYCVRGAGNEKFPVNWHIIHHLPS
jgi:hypothetical protein